MSNPRVYISQNHVEYSCEKLLELKGNWTEKAYFGVDDKLCLTKGCFAKITRKYDEQSKCTEEAYWGFDGTLCLGEDGFAKNTIKYDDLGNPIQITLFGVDGKPCIDNDGISTIKRKYDERGNHIEDAYFDTAVGLENYDIRSPFPC